MGFECQNVSVVVKYELLQLKKCTAFSIEVLPGVLENKETLSFIKGISLLLKETLRKQFC